MLPRSITHRYTGEHVTFLETVEETGGSHLLLEVTLPANGDGPPLHSHMTFTEEFTCVEGTLSLRLDGRRLELQHGEKALVLMGLKHTFTNAHAIPVKFTVKLTPGALFEEAMRIHYGLMDDNRTDARGNPHKFSHLALILWLQDTLIAGIPVKFQRWVLKRLVERGYRRGLYAGFEKYTGKPIDELLLAQGAL